MTDRLYYADAGVLQFDATVTAVSADGRQLVLDRSAFYPTSGGQPHDTGLLAGVAVVDVTEAEGDGDADGAVLHHLAAPYGGAVGDRVTGVVDAARRLDHQQQHSGQHLLSALAEDRFGWRTVGMHIGAAGCTVDLDTAGVGDEALAALEAQVNDAVAAALPVTVSFEAAATAAGLRRPSARGGTLRIVTIAGVDRNACGGTHVAHSAQVGLVRLLRGEGIRGGTRVHFLCGGRALRQARQAHAWLHEAARTLSAGVEELPGVVARQADRLVAQERELTRLRETLGAHEARLLHATAAPDADGVRRLVYEVQGGVKAHEPLARAAAALPGCALLLLSHDTGGCCWPRRRTAAWTRGRCSRGRWPRTVGVAAGPRAWRRGRSRRGRRCCRCCRRWGSGAAEGLPSGAVLAGCQGVGGRVRDTGEAPIRLPNPVDCRAGPRRHRAAALFPLTAPQGARCVPADTPVVTDPVHLAIDTIRTLAMDAVQAAESGHPGTPMALAPLAYALYARHLRHDPSAPQWMDRDRFVLSVGHASMLLYGALHLSGYDLPLEELRRFRQWGSRTAGHPEVHHTPGVETTTGPLGQGIGNAVGMALAEAMLAAHFNRPGHAIVDHYTYFIAGDGCLMEGISHEAASFAGHHGLGKLIGFFDDNGITIDGSTALSCSDDAAQRFAALGWQVLHVADVNDLAALDAAIAEAKADAARPTLVITKTHIGFGSPNRQDSAKAHGEPLGAAEIALTKAAYGWPGTEPFFVPEAARAHWQAQVAERAAAHADWRTRWAAYAAAHPELAAELERRMRGELPAGVDAALPAFDEKSGAVASRAASGVVLNALAPVLPELVGGSADLSGSNLTVVKGAPVRSTAEPGGRNLHFGIREHGMGAIMNGLGLHGGFIPYGGTFLVFSDYMRPAIRLAALMGVHAIYVFTHDSIGLGEDGPTHQPVEHLAALRCIPNLLVLRPADADEVAAAWRLAVTHRGGPVALVLTRQKLPWLGAPARAHAGVPQGAYVVSEAEGGAPQVVLLATGSEVEVALGAQQLLAAQGTRARVVSCPSLELLAAQSAEARAALLPAGVPRVAVEAAHGMSWHRWVGDTGAIVSIDRFGASAPYQVLYREYGITAERVAEAARGLC